MKITREGITINTRDSINGHEAIRIFDGEWSEEIVLSSRGHYKLEHFFAYLDKKEGIDDTR